jgi:hypothetical protein
MADMEPFETLNLNRDGHAVGPGSQASGETLPWSRARKALVESAGPGRATFLSTTRPDGRPHAAGIGALWHDGDLYFTSGPGARKARNLAANSAATISMAAPGIDLILDGTVSRVTDDATLETVAAGYREQGWPAVVEGDAFNAPFNAPSAGPPPWYLYRFTFHTVIGVGTAEPHGATRWRFDR